MVNLSLEYVDLFTVSESASRLFPIDDVDRVTPYERLSVRIRNRWQRRGRDGLETYLTFEIHAAWFPEGEQPLGRRGDAFIDFTLAWWDGDRAGVGLRADVDPERGRLDSGSVEGWWRARRNLRLGASVRHLEGDSDIATLSVETEVDTRWHLMLFSQFDLKSGDSLDQGLLIQRMGHTAVFGLRFTFDPGDDAFSVSFKVDLLEAFRKKESRRRRAVRLSEFYPRSRSR